MNFNDLPADWPRRSVTDPEIVDDFLDLAVSERDRHEGAICLMICHADGRLLQPCAITGDPAEPTPAERRQMLDNFAAGVDGIGGAGIVLATARRYGTVIDDVDRGWHQTALDVCRSAGIRLFGAYRVSLDGVTELPAPDAMAEPLGA